MGTIQTGEFRDAGMINQVTELTADAAGWWLRALSPGAGQLLEGMDDAAFFRYIVSATGAVLEGAADGLRVAPAALGDGLTGGGASQIALGFAGLGAEASPALTDLLAIETAGGIRKVTRADLINAAAPTHTMSVTNATGAPLVPGELLTIESFDVANDVPNVTLADAASGKRARAAALTAIAAGGQGDVLVSGVLSGPNTTGLAVGDRVYLANSGAIQAADPAVFWQQVGYVLQVSDPGKIWYDPNAPTGGPWFAQTNVPAAGSSPGLYCVQTGAARGLYVSNGTDNLILIQPFANDGAWPVQ